MINEPSTLVILSPGFPANEADTACLPAQQVFIRALNKTFPDLTIIILAFNYPFGAGSYQWYGNTVISFAGRDRGGWRRLSVWWRVWRKLRELKRGNSLFGIFSWWCTECALIGKWFGKRYSIPHFCWILGQDARPGNKYIRWIRPAGGQLVAMSEFLAGEFERNYRIRPAHIIHNGIDPAMYDPAPAEKDLELFGAGSLIPLKNWEAFIRVVHRLKEHIPDVRAVLCGAGPEEVGLRTMIGQYGLTDNLLMIGKKEHREVLRLMQRAKVFLHPSTYEGFSTVCLEALYAGAQVISVWNPMAGWIRHWHIVADEEEMVREALEILGDGQRDEGPVMPYRMEDSAWEVGRLFGLGAG